MFSAVVRAAGLMGGQNVAVEFLDRDTAELVKRSVPAYSLPDDPKVREQFRLRLGRTLLRHGMNAGRDAVADTAELGLVRNAKTHRPVEGRVGYARVLGGGESCSFCAMLASRGPVYKQDTVLRRRDGRRYHDGCNCRSRLMVEGKPWVGEKEYKQLEAQWRKYTWDDGRPGEFQWARWKAAVDGGKVDPTDYSPFETGSSLSKELGKAPARLGDVSRKGSKRTKKSALSKANPTGDMYNCVRCVNAWGMRKFGHDVAAVPGQPGITAEESTKTWRNVSGHGSKTPTWIKSAREGGGLKWSQVKAEMDKEPEGSFGFLRFKTKRVPHVVVWEKTHKGILVSDPQTAAEDCEFEVARALSGTFAWTNLKGYEPTKQTGKIVRSV